jgi:hypothetical protein
METAHPPDHHRRSVCLTSRVERNEDIFGKIRYAAMQGLSDEQAARF